MDKTRILQAEELIMRNRREECLKKLVSTQSSVIRNQLDALLTDGTLTLTLPSPAQLNLPGPAEWDIKECSGVCLEIAKKFDIVSKRLRIVVTNRSQANDISMTDAEARKSAEKNGVLHDEII